MLQYGYHKYSGLELMNFKIKQRLRKLQFIHKLITHPTRHLLIKTLIEWYQVSLDLSEQILIHPSLASPYIKSTWVQRLDSVYVRVRH